MPQLSPSQFLKDAKQDEALKNKLINAETIQDCVEIADSYGYKLSNEELQAEFNKLPDEVIGELINPGVTPRRHLDSH
jgi:Nif11 domain